MHIIISDVISYCYHIQKKVTRVKIHFLLASFSTISMDEIRVSLIMNPKKKQIYVLVSFKPCSFCSS